MYPKSGLVDTHYPVDSCSFQEEAIVDPASASVVGDSAKEFGGLGQHCEPALLRSQISIIMRCLFMHSAQCTDKSSHTL